MKKNRRSARVIAAAGALLATGTVGALAFSGLADAADSSTAVVSTAAAAPAASSNDSSSAAPADAPARGTETPLTGDDLAKATAAANTAVPGATIVRAETDADGAAYEVHVTKADGTQATVKLNADFTVKTVETGGPGGGPGGGHGKGGPRGGQAPASDGSSSATSGSSTTTN